MKIIPNLFTLLNLFFGCIAIVFILQTGQTLVTLETEGFTSWELPEKITWASLFIFAAAIVDFLDGLLARLLKAESAMGKQLDSLADVVSFGVAPAMILFQLLRLSFARQEGGLDVSIVMLLPAFILPCATAWRLARFNLDEEQRSYFKGVPSPAIGLVVASFPLIIFYEQLNAQNLLLNRWLLYLIIVVLSGLMIVRWPLMNMKMKGFSFQDNMPRYILVVLAMLAAILLKWVAVPVILLLYVLVSLAFKNKIS
jgi:CDP-diacylglycerol--serine O-phosphatidyltransferase